MNQRKVFVCQLLFLIVLFSLFFSTWFVKTAIDGFRLFDIVTSTISILWLVERVEKFGKWLQKTDY